MIIISGRQIRAARALLNWSQRELSKKSKVAFGTIQRMEKFDGPVESRTETLARVVTILEKAGIVFLNDESPGLRLTAGRIKLRGRLKRFRVQNGPERMYCAQL